MRRSADFVAALALAPLAVPVGLVAALALCVVDGGPVIFAQERVGRGRKPFTIYKFRTMRDGQVTPVGGVLRKTGLDEVPQLYNVMRGDMSLVGPRPLLLSDIARLGWDRAKFDSRWSVRPGIVGPVQIWSTMACDARLSWIYDRAYVERASLRTDMGLIAAAGMCALLGKPRAARLLSGFRRMR